MKTMMLELRILFRSRLAGSALLLLLVLASLAIWNGLRVVDAQKAALERVAAAHEKDFSDVAAKYRDGGDAGYAAYYTFHLTWDAPSPLTFIAVGQRDLQPFSLRVRMLGLHSQLYESETVNPEMALPGRFDFVFVLIYLVPLVAIALMHDWVSEEREAGRLRLLLSLPRSGMALWMHRTVLRYAVVIAAILLPLFTGLAVSGALGMQGMGMALIAMLYTAFWFGVCMTAGAVARNSASSAAILLGLFVLLTLVLPAMANAAIQRLVPAGKGAELAMAQRQEVHQAWDQPKDVTFRKFFRSHPEWSDTPPVTGRFHWKWYYAMHQAGDDAVAAQAMQYRQSLRQRDEWTQRAGWLLPPAAAQLLAHRLADTDLVAHLAYLDEVGTFHAQLRRYYYPFVFQERLFGQKEFQQLPRFQSRAPSGSLSAELLGALVIGTLLALVAGFFALRRIRLQDREVG